MKWELPPVDWLLFRRKPWKIFTMPDGSGWKVTGFFKNQFATWKKVRESK